MDNSVLKLNLHSQVFARDYGGHGYWQGVFEMQEWSCAATGLLLMGVHTNMCVLNRSFAIKQMVRWGRQVALIRDLTDAMYNPAMPPYVSHQEGTRLVIEYIEKFWCPTLLSEEILNA